MRTRQEVRNFLESQLGKSVNAKSAPYQGQCVSLIKALLEFLGVPNPYAARGNAKDAGDIYVRQGIAKSGDGWLRVVVNRSMGNIRGVTYGHIWVDLANEANYEQNGARALHTTKNTRPYSQRQQVVNLDQWIKPEAVKKSNDVIAREVLSGKWGNNPQRKQRLEAAGYNYSAVQAIVNSLVAKPTPAPAAQYYTVKRGDNMSRIAARHGLTLTALAKLNPQVKNLNLIHPNDRIRVR